VVAIDAEAKGTGRDLITSRILRLQGEEPGLNQGAGIDSYERYIYLHGTDEENRLGTPASHGCIRMRNADIIELYPHIAPGTPVLILEEAPPAFT
jgi:lipoprotein-anchoring transpeptidase ErfK/SrfK